MRTLEDRIRERRRRKSSLASLHITGEYVESCRNRSSQSLIAAPSAISTPGKGFPIEWYNFRLYSPAAGFDLEMWWRRSILSTRVNLVVMIIFLTLAITNFVTGIVLVCSHFNKNTKNPYVCRTDSCQKASRWMARTMNTSVNPCENFYEFMCGNLKEEDFEINSYSHLIHEPGFKIEYGEDSILGARKTFGLTALTDTIQKLFGTHDLHGIGKSSATLEEIGAKVFGVTGHASFISMGFYTYPYIQFTRPPFWVAMLDYRVYPTNIELVRQLFANLLPELFPETPAKSLVYEEMVYGVGIWTEIVGSLLQKGWFAEFPFSQQDPYPPPGFQNAVEKALNGLCPPMGFKVDISRIFELFLNEIPRYEYFDLRTRRYVMAVEICLRQEPSKFTKYPFMYPKSAFVSIWILGIFEEFKMSMDLHLLEKWNVTHLGYPRLQAINSGLSHYSTNFEYLCMWGMWRTFGYVPPTRYIQSFIKKPITFIQNNEEKVMGLYEKTRTLWSAIEKTGIESKLWKLGSSVLSHGLRSNVIMPLPHSMLDEQSDPLPLTDDNLRNSILGTNYLIEKSKGYWRGSTDTIASIKWWAYGDPDHIRDRILGFLFPVYGAASLLEEVNALGNNHWEKFLGRQRSNYILFPLAIFAEPHITDLLAIQDGILTYKIIRSIMTLIVESYRKDYTATSFGGVIGGSPSSSLTGNACQVLNPASIYQLELVNTDSFYASYVQFPKFLSLIATKMAYKNFRIQRDKLKTSSYDWTVAKKEKFINKLLLPDQLSKYSEKQLFFMSFVRQACRGSWKTHPTQQIHRFHIELDILDLLMQMEEFSEVWKCPKNSFMNLNEDRCWKWAP